MWCRYTCTSLATEGSCHIATINKAFFHCENGEQEWEFVPKAARAEMIDLKLTIILFTSGIIKGRLGTHSIV